MAFTVICALCVPAAAADFAVVDDADLLDPSEAEQLEDVLETVSQKHDIDIVVLTVPSLMGKSPEDYAVEYYDGRYGDDGVLMLVSMYDRQWYFLSAGKCKARIPADAFEGEFVDLLGQEDYYEAFTLFANICDRRISNFIWVVIGISLAIGAVIGLIVVLVMKSKLKTVRSQSHADQYVGGECLQLTGRSDIFLYQTVTRRARPQSDNGSRGSSGRSYGGGGGRF